ncbi:MAG: hypothetical protein MI975_28040 [Cytophagales bacterium]|nr:hypothetical protein [Cytophagales bacterium]
MKAQLWLSLSSRNIFHKIDCDAVFSIRAFGTFIEQETTIIIYNTPTYDRAMLPGVIIQPAFELGDGDDFSNNPLHLAKQIAMHYLSKWFQF